MTGVCLSSHFYAITPVSFLFLCSSISILICTKHEMQVKMK